MKPICLVLSACVLACSATVRAAVPAASPSFAQPTLSPDGSRIAFVANSAIWSVPAQGGEAHLLVADGGDDRRPLYSPDGTRLAFVSDVTGNGDIYVLDLGSGALQRVTWSDAADELDAWSRDGQWLYFSSGNDNIGRMQGVFRVRAGGGTPMPVSVETYRNEQQGAPSPDGKSLALVAGGLGNWQWWRHGRSHIDEGAIWLMRDDASRTYRRLTPDDARADWPMWSADGRALFYMSDRGGNENLWRVAVDDGAPTPLTTFHDGRVLWPSISADGRNIAFERDFGIWLADTASGQARPVAITLGGATRAPASRHESLDKGFSELAVAPDGRKLAFIARGEVFAADADKGGEATRITRGAGESYAPAWAPDSRRLVYGSVRDGGRHLYLYDFADGSEKALTSGDGEDTAAAFAPDGKSLAFVRDGHELHWLDLANGRAKKLVDVRIDLRRPLGSDRAIAWSPDGRWIAYLAYGERMFRNAHAVSVADGKDVTLSLLANTAADDIDWSADGKSVLFATSQRTEPGDVARVDLVARTPVFREDGFHDLFKETRPAPAPQAGKRARSDDKDKHEEAGKPARTEPVRIDAAGIRERLDLLPIGLDVQLARISPDGKTLVVAAAVAGKTNLYAWSLDPLDTKAPVARQLTATPGDKASIGFDAEGKNVFYLDDGRIFSVALKDDGKPKAIAATAELDIDFAAEKQVMFDQAWRWLRDNFHDAAMNGADWNAVRARYAPRIAGAQTPAALRRLLNLMVGELDASHSGVSGPDRPQETTGRLGLRFDRAAYEHDGTLRVTGIVPLSPAAVGGKIEVGDELLAIDDTPVGAGVDLARLLDHRIDRKTTLRVKGKGGARNVDVKPIGARVETELAYAAWTADNRAYVDRVSHGRLGYVHLRDMSSQSLQNFYRDLDAQNSTRDGVVVDERNNFGGFVNAYALDVLSRRPYLRMTFRGFDAQPARSILGQRALERPSVLVTNRVTLSDGEDFSEGYRALGLGKIVGEPTAGWIIYTDNARLIDGSSVRLPFITITDNRGQPLEMHPRPVDVPVERPLGESLRSVDSELDAAVSTLLQQIGMEH